MKLPHPELFARVLVTATEMKLQHSAIIPRYTFVPKVYLFLYEVTLCCVPALSRMVDGIMFVFNSILMGSRNMMGTLLRLVVCQPPPTQDTLLCGRISF